MDGFVRRLAGLLVADPGLFRHYDYSGDFVDWTGLARAVRSKLWRSVKKTFVPLRS